MSAPSWLPGVAGARHGCVCSALHGGGSGAGELLVTAAAVTVGVGDAAQAASVCGVLHALG